MGLKSLGVLRQAQDEREKLATAERNPYMLRLVEAFRVLLQHPAGEESSFREPLIQPLMISRSRRKSYIFCSACWRVTFWISVFGSIKRDSSKSSISERSDGTPSLVMMP
jgi:hypothetical protein